MKGEGGKMRGRGRRGGERGEGVRIEEGEEGEGGGKGSFVITLNKTY